MKIGVQIVGSITKAMQKEIRASRRAVKRGIGAAGIGLRDDWRAQVVAAGLGPRLARTIRHAVYPAGQDSARAAAQIWTRAPKIVDAFERGALIRSNRGLFLAIPTAAAGKTGLGRTRITPEGWERRTGMQLRLVYRRGQSSLLVADDVRIRKKSGYAAPKRRRRRKDGILTGAQTVPIFILVPQVRLPKRLNLAGAVERWAARAPDLIVANWPDD